MLGVAGPERHEITGGAIDLDPAVGSRGGAGRRRAGDDRVRARAPTSCSAALAATSSRAAGATTAATAAAPPTPCAAACRAFDGTSSPLSPELRRRMTGRSWHRGCPVGLGRLRVLDVPHWTMGDSDVHRGRLVVHRDSDGDVLRAMRGLLQARFPIRRMDLIDRYGGDDHRSMNADNTSAFNCRFVNGTNRWSEHAFGRALDLNPVENPYVTPSGFVSPPKGRPYANRKRRRGGHGPPRRPAPTAPSRGSAGSGAATGPAPRTSSTSRPAAAEGRVSRSASVVIWRTASRHMTSRKPSRNATRSRSSMTKPNAAWRVSSTRWCSGFSCAAACTPCGQLVDREERARDQEEGRHHQRRHVVELIDLVDACRRPRCRRRRSRAR